MSNVSDYPQGVRSDLTGQSSSGSPPKRDLASEAKDIGRDFQDKASGLGNTVSQTAREQLSTVTEAAEKFASGAKEKVNEAFREQRSAGADYLTGMAGAVRRAAGEIESEIPPAARFMRGAADQVESFAGSVKDRSPQEMLGEVQDFARRQPALFFGGAMVLGFALLRFLKSTPPSGSSREYRGPYQGG